MSTKNNRWMFTLIVQLFEQIKSEYNITDGGRFFSVKTVNSNRVLPLDK